MWIRSQDKERLMKTDYIIVNDNDILATPNSDSFLITIGEYSSQEKALKVLDMIQSAIMSKRTEKRHYFQNNKYITFNYYDSVDNLVFQMPLDSEVEENE